MTKQLRTRNKNKTISSATTRLEDKWVQSSSHYHPRRIQPRFVTACLSCLAIGESYEASLIWRSHHHHSHHMILLCHHSGQRVSWYVMTDEHEYRSINSWVQSSRPRAAPEQTWCVAPAHSHENSCPETGIFSHWHSKVTNHLRFSIGSTDGVNCVHQFLYLFSFQFDLRGLIVLN
jgi:hypothetical protein